MSKNNAILIFQTGSKKMTFHYHAANYLRRLRDYSSILEDSLPSRRRVYSMYERFCGCDLALPEAQVNFMSKVSPYGQSMYSGMVRKERALGVQVNKSSPDAKVNQELIDVFYGENGRYVALIKKVAETHKKDAEAREIKRADAALMSYGMRREGHVAIGGTPPPAARRVAACIDFDPV